MFGVPILLIILIVAIILLLPTAYAGLIGAPYAPTRMPVVKRAFDVLEVGEHDVLVDLGAGDGKIVLEAARRGARAIGYELSPIMWFVVFLRCLGNQRARALYGNFFKKKLPQDTTFIFCFLMPNHMEHLKAFVATQTLPAAKALLSYAFPLKGIEPVTIFREKNCAPLYVYDLHKLVNSN